MRRIAVYPGTFDPITFGHLDIIRRALRISDYLIVAIAKDSIKNSLFSLYDRIKMIEIEVKESISKKSLEVICFNGLLVDFVKARNANLIIRGLRAVSDFEYEFQMAATNYKLNSEIETIFLPASESTHFIASRLVKEIAKLGGDVSNFVPKTIEKRLKNMIK